MLLLHEPTTRTHLGGGIDGDEDHVGALDLCVDVRRKEQIAAAAGLDHFQQAGFIDGQVIGIPSVDLANSTRDVLRI